MTLESKRHCGKGEIMREADENLRVSVNVEISATALQAIVENAKQLTRRNEKGHYKVDTAEKVGEMISKFLACHDFEAFARDIGNY